MRDDDSTTLVVIDAWREQFLTTAALALNALIKHGAHRAQPIVVDGHTFAPEVFERWAANAMANYGKDKTTYLGALLRDALGGDILSSVYIEAACEAQWDGKPEPIHVTVTFSGEEESDGTRETPAPDLG